MCPVTRNLLLRLAARASLQYVMTGTVVDGKHRGRNCTKGATALSHRSIAPSSLSSPLSSLSSLSSFLSPLFSLLVRVLVPLVPLILVLVFILLSTHAR